MFICLCSIEIEPDHPGRTILNDHRIVRTWITVINQHFIDLVEAAQKTVLPRLAIVGWSEWLQIRDVF